MSAVDASVPWSPSGAWFGHFEGTVGGKLLAEFAGTENGTLVVVTARSGKDVVKASGFLEVNEKGITTANLNVFGDDDTQPTGTLGLIFLEMQPTRLRGRWSASTGDRGVFFVDPGEAQGPPVGATGGLPDNVAPSTPLQLIHRSKAVPKLRLFRDDVLDLTARMKRLLPIPSDVVVVAKIDGKEVRQFASDFWSLADLPPTTNTLNLSMTETGTGLLRSIAINFDPAGCLLNVTGPDEVWVSGVFAELETSLARRHNRWKLWYERHALNVNGLTLLVVLALLPNLAFVQRLVLLGVTVALMLVVRSFHNATTAVRVFLRKDRKDGSLIEIPRLLTGLAATGIAAAASGLYYAMSKGALRDLLEWIVGQT